jgi:hypothetical protein
VAAQAPGTAAQSARCVAAQAPASALSTAAHATHLQDRALPSRQVQGPWPPDLLWLPQGASGLSLWAAGRTHPHFGPVAWSQAALHGTPNLHGSAAGSLDAGTVKVAAAAGHSAYQEGARHRLAEMLVPTAPTSLPPRQVASAAVTGAYASKGRGSRPITPFCNGWHAAQLVTL